MAGISIRRCSAMLHEAIGCGIWWCRDIIMCMARTCCVGRLESAHLDTNGEVERINVMLEKLIIGSQQ